MQTSGLPSKQFLIRGGIAIAIVAVILIVQTNWFLGLFGKKSTALDPNTSVGDVVGKDSNGNGIPDWEERLWGLDPTVLYTGDMSNKEIIDNKKKALGLTEDDTENLNETERLARQLFSISTSLGQEGAALEDIGGAGEALGGSVQIVEVPNRYTYKDIKTVPTTNASLRAYQTQSITVIEKNAKEQADFNTVVTAIETGDYGRLPELAATSANYRQIAKELSAVSVPIGVAQFHLDSINALYGMAESFKYIMQMDDNAIVGLNGLAIYKEYSMSLDIAVEDLNIYLTEYGIL